MLRQINHPARLTALVVLISIFNTAVYSQNDSFFTKAYASAGIGPSTARGFGSTLTAQLMMKKNWTGSISFQTMDLEAKNLPDDYVGGSGFFLFLPMYDSRPTNNLTSINLTAGKYGQLGRRTWASAEAGISFVSGEIHHYTLQPVQQDYFLIGWNSTSNYSLTTETQHCIGGVIKADFHWAFLPFMGMGIGIYSNFNGNQSYFGGQLALTAGWMNLKKKNKN